MTNINLLGIKITLKIEVVDVSGYQGKGYRRKCLSIDTAVDLAAY